jgi:hypothetical protein
VVVVARPAMPVKNLSIITEEAEAISYHGAKSPLVQ